MMNLEKEPINENTLFRCADEVVRSFSYNLRDDLLSVALLSGYKVVSSDKLINDNYIKIAMLDSCRRYLNRENEISKPIIPLDSATHITSGDVYSDPDFYENITKSLTAKQKNIIDRVTKGYSILEIANELNTTNRNISIHLYKAKRKIKQLLKENEYN